MFKEKIKSLWEENKGFICLVGGIVVGGVIVGAVKNSSLRRALKNVVVFAEETVPTFPSDMPIQEIKDALSKVEGAKFMDALVSVIDGRTRIYIR